MKKNERTEKKGLEKRVTGKKSIVILNKINKEREYTGLYLDMKRERRKEDGRENKE